MTGFNVNNQSSIASSYFSFEEGGEERKGRLSWGNLPATVQNMFLNLIFE